ncbi:MAG: maltotransferase domain-containing protein, partial [Chloroflexota bacterium]
MAPQPAGERAEIAIEQVQPVVDGGRFAAKAEVDRPIAVSADIFAYGHGLLAAEVRWQPSGGEWHSAPLGLAGNDRWTGSFACTVLGRCHFTIEAWRDVFASWRQDVIAKLVTEEDARPDVEAGLQLIRRALTLGQASDTAAAERFLRRCEGCSDAATLAVAARDAYPAQEMRRLAREVAGPTLSPHFPVQVDRPAARFSAWYEMFPRSQGQDLRRGSTLREAAIRLPDIAAMGFDVLYLPPIHPIGETGRKGRDNAPLREPGDPGSPWAIGGAAGGHKSVHPKLGTLTDFADFVEQARALHLEVALDYALQCSPDHPYVREHPDWFFRRPDGSIRYAENPPKKYQDI